MFWHHNQGAPIREPGHSVASSQSAASQDGTINEADVRAALEGDLEAFKRLQSMGGHAASQAAMDDFLARGGPRLLNAVKQLGFLGIQIDPSSKFAHRLRQFWADVEAAMSGNLGAYLRVNRAQSIEPTAQQVRDFLREGG